MAQTTDDIFFSEGSGTVYEFYDNRNPRKDERKSWTWKKDDKDEQALWANWYAPDNDFPNLALDVITKNNILFGVTDKKINFLCGQRVRLYKEVIEDGKKRLDIVSDPMVEDWMERNSIKEMMHNRFMDDLWMGSNWVEAVLTKEGKVDTVRHFDATTCRTGKKNKRTGRVDSHFISSNWAKPVYDPSAKGEERKKNNVQRINAFDPTNPTKYAKFMLHTKRYMPGHPNYPLPYWYPTIEWFRLASKIPAWHSFGMDNGYGVRHHVEIPKSWLEQFPAAEREAKKAEVRKDMDEFLSGAKNNGKAFYSTYSNNGQLPDGWKINVIDTKLNDEAYTAIFGQSNTAVASGLGIDPTLANIMLEGKLGNASEKRIAYQIHMALDTPLPRQRQLDLLYLVARMNGWDQSLKFGFEDIEITKLDSNPTGEQNVIA